MRLYLATSFVFGGALAFALSAWMRAWLWSVLVMVPVFAAMLSAMPREPRYFSEHVVFSVHVHAFVFGIAALALLVVGLTSVTFVDIAAWVAIPVAWLVYLVGAARTHYQVGLGRAVVLGTLLTFGYGLLLAIGLGGTVAVVDVLNVGSAF